MSSGGGAVGGGPVGGGNLQDVNASQSDQVIASSSAAARGSVGAGWGGGYFRFDCIFRHLGCDSKIYTGNTACQLCVVLAYTSSPRIFPY